MAVVIAGYARTPFAKFTGALATEPASALGAHATSAALTRAGVDPEEVDRLYAGQVLLGGSGQNPARQTAVRAGIPLLSPAMTVNIVCLSGMEAVAAGADAIERGDADIVVAVGQESMSLAPHAWVGARAGKRYGAYEVVDLIERDALLDAFDNESMGAGTERGNARLGIDRQAQDTIALASNLRAAEGREFLAGEIAPYEVAGRKGTVTVSIDDGVRAESTAESLGSLRAAFAEHGTITAGNASQITDGAAAVVLMRADLAAARGVHPLAEIVAHALVAGPDTSLHEQPANAILAALDSADLNVDALQAIEINEAFAAVVIASAKKLSIDPAAVNRHGGAISLGHPVGASGARVTGTLARQLVELGAGTLAAAALCGGGGQGSALILRAL